MIPRARTIAIAVALAVGVAFYPDEVPGGTWGGLALLNGLLLLLATVDYALAPTRGAFTVERDHQRTIAVGSSGTITWTIDNPGRSRLRVRIADELAPSLSAERRGDEVVVPAGRTATASTTFTPTRRGRFEPTRLTVAAAGPLGLVWRQSVWPVPGAIDVHPRFRSRRDAEASIRRARTLQLGSRTSRGIGGGSEFEQLREYTQEDQFRHIDWGATARIGRPIVRVYQPEPNQSVVVLLDNGRLMAGNVADVPRLEHGIDATIALATVAVALGDKVGLVTFDQRVRTAVAPACSTTQVVRLTDAMFDLEGELLESDYGEVFRSTVARHRRRSLLVLVTELSGAAARDSLFPALPTLVRHHHVILACVSDPELTEWADIGATDPDEAFRSAAAATALAERRGLLARARTSGVTVIDASPGALPRELADAYVNWKLRGRG